MAKVSRPTLQDVAQEAGVSIASVSRILNGVQSGSSETARRVHTAIRELNYKPSSSTKSLPRARTPASDDIQTYKVHVFTRKFDAARNVFYHQIVEGCFDFLANNHVHIKVTYLSYSPKTQLKIDEADYQMHDAALFIGERVEEVAQEYMRRGKPIVVVDDLPPDQQTDWIIPDNYSGMMTIVRQFLAHGHRKLAYAGPIHGAIAWEERHHAFLAILAEHGITFDKSCHIDCVPDFNEASQALAAFYAKPAKNRPAGIVCANDIIASAAIEQAIKQNLRVPEDVAISGFDHDLTYQLMKPRLTTVSFPRDAMGREAAYRILARLKGESLPGMKIVVPTTFIPGESAGFDITDNPAGRQSR